MDFSGFRGLVLLAVLIGMIALVSAFDLPRWLVAVGVVVSGVALQATKSESA